jgi:predicted metal-dependent HD superfamily phosphohydrolase
MDEALLTRSWQRAWRGLRADGEGDALRRALLARWAEPHRHYHALQHLEECLSAFEAVQALAEHPAEVEMALWFHDAVYDTRASDNEERSADWAREALRAHGVDAEAGERVHALVMATRHTALPDTPDARLLVDIDLSILGASDARFAQYERQIREEYSFVPGWLFRRKRRAILQTFLDRSAIFSSAHFAAALEARARRNLRQALGAEHDD